MSWSAVCLAEMVPEGAGVAALLDGGEQVAVFRLPGGEWYGLSNIDPVGGAAVLSRGIVGDAAGVPVVASPLFKERFELRTGKCLDVEGVRVPAYPVRVFDGVVHVGSP
jgi:nitrite reductase (NADH) small subunit